MLSRCLELDARCYYIYMDLKSRITWIDVARGIGIILVIYGHALDANSIRHLIYAFHMPLFFFLSGIVFHHKKEDRFVPFLKKNVRSILIPYFIFAFITWFWWIFEANTMSFKIGLDQFLSIFYGNGADGMLRFDNVLWFLPCLFVARIMFYFVTKYSQDNRRRIAAALIGFSIFGYGIAQLFPNLALPFGIEIALTGIVYLGVGYLWNTQTEYWKEKFHKHSKYIFAASLTLCLIIAQLNFQISGYHIDFRINRYDNYFLFYTAAFSGILSTLALSIWIHHNRILEYIGKKTMILFIFHTVLFVYFTKIVTVLMSWDTINQIRSIYIAPIYTLAAIAIILGVDYLLLKSKVLVWKKF